MKRPYSPPKLTKYESMSDLPEHLREELEGKLFVVFNRDRTYLLVSDAFAQMLGYDARELVGKRVDDITPQNVVNIELAFRALLEMEEMGGLWLLKHRTGRNLLVRYHAHRGPDFLYADIEPVPFENESVDAA